MIIILEGPDGSGKTTLKDSLLSVIPDSLSIHFGNPTTEEEALNYWKVYAETLSNVNATKTTILDRCWYSDLVYGPIFRNKSEMDILHVRMLEAMVYKHGGGFVVYCTASVPVLWARCKKRGEDYVKTKELLSRVSSSYEKVMLHECNLPVIRYDTSKY